jgi:glucokinase
VTTAEALTTTDPELASLVAEAIETMALHIANLAIALDPEKIVLGGGLTTALDRILPRLKAVLGAAVPFPPSLSVAEFATTAPLLGAVAAALDLI